jgi:hypothetical protein
MRLSDCETGAFRLLSGLVLINIMLSVAYDRSDYSRPKTGTEVVTPLLPSGLDVAWHAETDTRSPVFVQLRNMGIGFVPEFGFVPIWGAPLSHSQKEEL